MSFAAKAALKPISMATIGCITSVPSLFTSSKASYLRKPINFQVSCSYSSTLPFPLLKKKTPISRVSVIAAQQEEGNPVLLEEQEGGDLNWAASDSDGAVEAAGDAGEGDGFVEPPEEAKLYVGNLPYDVDSEGLAYMFQEAGVVEEARVVYNRDTDRSKGFGFVTMSTVEEADKAVRMFNRYDFNGRLLTVNIAAQKGTRPPRVFEPSYRIYVGNLPWSADDARLEQLFSEHGKVVSARVVSDRDTGRSRGFGFVVMASEAEMNDAIANLDGQNLDGRAIRVNVAEERPRRSSF